MAMPVKGRVRAAVFAVGVLWLQGAAVAQERRIGTLDDLLPNAAKFLALPGEQRDRLDLRYMIRLKGQPITDARFWVVDGGERIGIPVGADGGVDLDRVAPLLPRGLDVWTDVEKGGGSVSLSLEPRLNPGTQMPAADLLRAVEQANAVIRKQAGAMSLLAPTMKAVAFTLPEGATGDMVFPDGRREALRRLADGRLSASVRALKKAERVEFSAAPLRDSFED